METEYSHWLYMRSTSVLKEKDRCQQKEQEQLLLF